nr:immunoglobulin heavy chain junction region [Mus musculus]MBK4195531.1 immunoglobulin heavy chain junction region [Mus musculus]MBK4196883.1 immunoglobulin heavy chain junction region [Mus musculus]MBK4196884.1 immunoglobulin heavy chain junction region [Mus musculus]MBK4196886.1 immunoglobulin heavy chain junction region [Mus musculus]
CARSTYAMDYW